MDADDTLFDYSKGEQYALEKSLEEFGINDSFEQIRRNYTEINLAIWKEFEKGTISADDLKVARFDRLFERIGAEVNAAKFSDSYLTNLSEATFLINGIEELLKELHGKFKLAIITNGLTKVQRPRFDRSRIGKYFDEYIVSEEIGLQKPDPAIFDYAFKKLDHADKSTSLMIGDNLNSDILGGYRFGIDTCWFNPERKENESSVVPTFTIVSLQELRELLF